MNYGLLTAAGRTVRFVDLHAVLGSDLQRFPWTMRIIAENAIRRTTGTPAEALGPFLDWLPARRSEAEIAFHPARLLMHDTTCVPALVDIAALRDALAETGGDPALLNPRLPVDVSIDHSVAVDVFGTREALGANMRARSSAMRERYRLMKWAAGSLRNMTVHPPGTGIMHTINLEQLATVVTICEENGVAPLSPTR